MNLFSKLKEMKMLLIDDDELIRDSLMLFFEGEGCRLMACETAEEGLQALKGQCYDIIITDYLLPGMDGVEFCRRIRKTQPHAIKILITAYRNEGLVCEGIKAGIHDFIDKPFTTEAIERALSRLIQERLQNCCNARGMQEALEAC